MHVDGNEVGDQVLDSPWTSFYTNRSYTTHRIRAAALEPGPHTLALRVGQGFCTSADHDGYDPAAERSAIVQLHVRDSSGTLVQTVASDGSWQASSRGPIVRDSTYYGEVYDARLETPGWTMPGFVPAGPGAAAARHAASR